jgi:hypothetical protein
MTDSSVVFILAFKVKILSLSRNTSSNTSVSDLNLLKLRDAEFYAAKAERYIEVGSRVVVPQM